MAAASHPDPDRAPIWLHGPFADLLLGAGLGYLLSVPLLLFGAGAFGFTEWSLEGILLMGLAVSTPHYGATLLRVYERSEGRQRYVFFARYVSLAIVLLVIVALYTPWLGSLILTLYLAWSPWHFAGQNYGLSLVFLRRSRVDISAAAKRSLYVFFFLSFALTFVVFQTQDASAVFAPNFSSAERDYETIRVGIPVGIAGPMASVLLAGLLASLGAALWMLWRGGASLRALTPVACLAVSQSMWFSIPAYANSVGRPLEGIAFAAVWASVAHSIQYLWVTSYYAKRESPDTRLPVYYLKALLAGCLIAVVPGLLVLWLAPAAPSWTGGLALLLFAALNLHHFLLDGAIWKLRDGRVARVLLRPEAAQASGSDRQGAGARALVWGLAVVCLAVVVLEIREAGAYRSRDLARLESATRHLEWIGRERVALLGTLGDAYFASGERQKALATYRHALDLRWDAAVANNLAWHLATGADSDVETGAEAVVLAERSAAEFGDADYDALDTLAAAYAAAGRFDEAAAAARRGVELAAGRDAGRAAEIEARLALYEAGQPFRTPSGRAAD